MTTQNAARRSRIWSDWDVPLHQVLRGFAAAASFYRAMPWLSVTESTNIRAILPGGGRWTITINGPAEACGMCAYPEDGRAPHDEDVWGNDEARCISLSFGTNEIMPEEVLREIREGGGDVAGPAAYPRLLDIGGENGDITLAELQDVITVVEAVPRYVKARQRLLAAEGVLARRWYILTQVCWTDDASGVQFEDVTPRD